MSTNSFFNQRSIQNIKKMHKGFLWVASGVIVVSLMLGGVLIFVDSSANSELFAKVQGTFTILALVAFICVNNLIRIEKGNKAIQGFALTGLFANMVWLVMSIMMIWGAFLPVEINTSDVKTENTTVRTYDYRRSYDTLDSGYDDYDYDEYDYDEYDYDDYDYDDVDYYNDYDYDNYDVSGSYQDEITPSSYTMTTTSIVNLTIAGKLLIIAISVASIGFWVSNVLAIKDRVKVVMLLKTVAVVCQVITSAFVIVLACTWPIAFDQNLFKWVQLFGLASSGFLVTALAAWIISISHKDFDVVSIDGEVQGKKNLTESDNTEKKTMVEDDNRDLQGKEPTTEPGSDEKGPLAKEEDKVEEEKEITNEIDEIAEESSSREDDETTEQSIDSNESGEDESGFEGFSDNSENQ